MSERSSRSPSASPPHPGQACQDDKHKSVSDSDDEHGSIVPDHEPEPGIAAPHGAADLQHDPLTSAHDPRATLDNFEHSQAINVDAEDMYLIDEGVSLHERKHKAESTEEHQKFILLFAKALLSFGAPSYRIEAQLNSLAKVFGMHAWFQHTPGIIQVSFENPKTKMSDTCFIKSSVRLALGRIQTVHNIYHAVLHDKTAVSIGTSKLQQLLITPPTYGPKLQYLFSFITCLLICGVAFGGSLNDMWVAGFMGLLVRTMQSIASKLGLSTSGSEVFTAALVSFIARAFAGYYTQIWCFSAISSAGVVSLLPGFLIRSLDIAGKNQSLGVPKIVSGIITSVYLGFGLMLGSDAFLFLDRTFRHVIRTTTKNFAGSVIIQDYYQAFNGSEESDKFSRSFIDTSTLLGKQGCFRDDTWGWYLQPMLYWTLLFLVPLLAFCSSMNNQQRWCSRQMLVMVSITCISFWIARMCNNMFDMHNHPAYVSLIGSWSVGILGNGYSRCFGGTAFTVMLTGILLLVPDGLSAAGGLAQTYAIQGQDEYTQSLTLARKMISVIIGILAGVYSSAAMIRFFGGKKKDATLVTF